ncbi:S8 family serine peptidase [Ekhidna sp.]|uniref:S8 family serine peptidase n=1 Tax=Ekhidna sp. TaxID=2608089 RepID=UPI003B505908
MRRTLKLSMIIALIIGSYGTMAQNSFGNESLDEYLERRSKSLERAQSLGYPMQIGSGEDALYLQYLDDSDNPVYYTTYNDGAAKTTGAVHLQQKGHTGLELTGEGIVVGVWDGGQVQSDHVEFVGRTSHKDNSTSISNHATHVTGTILATGVNVSAKGMAPLATSHNYDFNADLGEVVEEAEKGLILSNHSYGATLGWTFSNGGWVWNGDPEISDVEDYRFGLYTSGSRAWDNVIHSNPYYLSVHSAGNHRGDVGSGTGAPGDGPFDIISPDKCAKNILTVGAVSSINDGDFSPANIQMSSFSSWGPTDDGRIKPDLVGMGVNLFSANSGSSTSYGTSSGTSMSAPNVTGSLALIQELYHRYNGEFMLASSLKALAIHTAREAGSQDGPDYQYGWGLLDVAAAANVLKYLDNESQFFVQDELSNEEIKNYFFNATEGQKVKATIVWTDVPGNPLSGVLDPTDLALINDLDIKVTSPSTTEHLPWIIQPDSKIVSKGDNFRDNVEVIEFVAGETGAYELVLSHKNTLDNEDSQVFSMFISVGDPKDLGSTLWLTEDNNAQVWKNQAGESVASGEISQFDQLIIADADNNYILDGNLTAHSLTISEDATGMVDLNGFEIALTGSLISKNNDFKFINGSIRLSGDFISYVDLEPNSIDEIDLTIDKNNFTNISESIHCKALNILSGDLYLKDLQVNVDEFIIGSLFTDSLKISTVTFNDVSTITLPEEVKLSADNVIISSNVASTINAPNLEISDMMVESNGSVTVSSIKTIKSITISGDIILDQDLSVKNFTLNRGSNLILNESITLTIEDLLSDQEDDGNANAISSEGSGALIVSQNANKFCFENMTVTDVSVEGNTKFVLDANSTASNSSDGWILDECGNVLAADFVAESACSGGITRFVDISDGSPVSWEWTIVDLEETVVLINQNPEYEFVENGTYEVILKVVADDGEESMFTKMVEVISADIGKPEIIVEDNSLRSSTFANFYQWFFNGEPIDGETSFVLTGITNEGEYYIELYSTKCTIRSDVFFYEVTGLNDIDNFFVYPTVSSDIINIKGIENYRSVEILSLDGKKVLEIDDNVTSIDISGLNDGRYLLLIKSVDDYTFQTDFIKRD